MPRVMLDAGHYAKYNRSPSVSEYWESDMSWQLHLCLKSELEKYGIEVGTTRQNKDSDLDVYYRGKCAKGYDMFISLHSNATGTGANENVDHPVVFRLLSDKTEGDTLARKISEMIAETMGTRESGRVATRQNDNGGEYYGVLRGASAARCPHAYIVEHSFHTCTASAKWLLCESNLTLLAQKQAKLIAQFFGIETKVVEEDTMDQNKIIELEKRICELEKSNQIYHYYTDLPAWSREQIERLHRSGVFCGNGAGDINLSKDMVRMLVILANNKIL